MNRYRNSQHRKTIMNFALLPLVLVTLAAPPWLRPLLATIPFSGSCWLKASRCRRRGVQAAAADPGGWARCGGATRGNRQSGRRPRPAKELVRKSYFAPVAVKVRTVKASEGEGPAVRTIDVWFVAHGDWDTLTSKDFLESTTAAENGKSRVVSKSGA